MNQLITVSVAAWLITGCANPDARPAAATPRASRTSTAPATNAASATTRPPVASSGISHVATFIKAVEAEVARAHKQQPDQSRTRGWGVADGTWTLPVAWCLRQAKLPTSKKGERCKVARLGGKRAAVMIVTLSCHDEHCEFGKWVVTTNLALRKVDDDLGGRVVLSPDARHVFVGSAELSGPGEYEAKLTRIDLLRSTKSVVAACAAPVISPGAKWLVCRDTHGHVYRMPVAGGKLTLVHKVRPKAPIQRSPHLGVALTPVVFLDAKRFRVDSIAESGDKQSEQGAWRE